MPNNRKKKALAAKKEVEDVPVARPPPDGLMENEYALCKQMLDTGACQYGTFCISAHSVTELQEWKKRFIEKTSIETKKNKTLAAKLLEQMQINKNSKIVLSMVPNIVCTAEPELHSYINRTPFEIEWKFLLHGFSPLLNVYLLFEESKDNFVITEVSKMQSTGTEQFTMNDDKEWSNVDWETDKLSDNYQYSVTVKFNSGVFGTFRQSVIFDFGIYPLLQKELTLDVKQETDDVPSAISKAKLVRADEIWSVNNSIVIPYNDQVDEDDELLSKYPLLKCTSGGPSGQVDSLQAYRSKMHYYLSLEEFARFEIMSRFNISIELTPVSSYCRAESLSSLAKYAPRGSFYGKIEFPATISEDTEYGKTLLSCTSLFLSETNVESGERRVAYMSTIENFSKSEIYINLSTRIVKDLALIENKVVTVNVQFILNRRSYCEMHQSLDRIQCFGHLYPKVTSRFTIPWDTYKQFTLMKEHNLNVKQKEAIIAMIATTVVPLPPVVIIGPYGTGKTFTLANAIPEILKDSKNNILICTHSNSAADIYIKDYLHEMRQNNRAIKPLRIYYTKRWRKSVPLDVLKYCLYNERDVGFCNPTMENLLDNNVIITTINTSYILTSLGIKPGFFTHIIIDEAAQIMECAALIPLALANEKTRVILAGDYMQIGEEIFSEECKDEGFNISLLERLFKYYPESHPCRILLRENYRSQAEIVNLTSDLFYEGKICGKSEKFEHLYYKPLCFFAASGDDFQDKDSTSFCNHAEILEIGHRIDSIKAGWPVSTWGNIDASSFGIITPYLDQVTRIRKHLKNQRMGQIAVERIYNVQGKEFKVTLLSTVRTRKTCTQADDESDYGFMSNPKLITTAITRAKYMVAIVGDPVALCTIGKCRNIWKEIVERCARNESLYGITLKELQTALRANELQRIHGLNPLAKEFVPRILPVLTPTPQMPMLPKLPMEHPLHHGELPTYAGALRIPKKAVPTVHQSNVLGMPFNASQYQQPVQRNNQIPYVSLQSASRPLNSGDYMAQQLPQSRALGHVNTDVMFIPEERTFNTRTQIVDSILGPAKARETAATVSDIWDNEIYSGIWSMKDNSSKEATRRGGTLNDFSRNLSNLNTQQDYSHALEALRLKQGIDSKPLDSVSAALRSHQQQGSLQIQNPTSLQMTAQSLGISNLIMPTNPVPIIMPPSQQSLPNLSYIPPSTHILSPSYQSASQFGAVLSPTLSNTDLMRHPMARQDTQILSPTSVISGQVSTTSPYGPLTSNKSPYGPLTSNLHPNPTTPTRPDSYNLSSQNAARLFPRQKQRDPFAPEPLLSSQQSGLNAPLNNPDYLPQSIPSPQSCRGQTSPFTQCGIQTSPFAATHIANKPRTPTVRSRWSDPSFEQLLQNPPLNYSGQNASANRAPTVLNKEILTAHGIPVPSNQSLLSANSMVQNAGGSLGQSIAQFQNLHLGEGLNFPNSDLASYSNPLNTDGSSHVDNPAELSFLEDLLNVNKRK